MSIDSKEIAFTVGKVLEHDVYDREQRLLLKKGNTIKTDRQLDAILNRESFFNDQQRNELQKTGEMNGKVILTSPFHALDQVRVSMENLYDKEESSVTFCAVVTVLAALVHRVCEQDADACLSTLLRPLEIRYSIKHMIDTAIVCEVVSKRLGYSIEDRLSLLAAALTMNIAMCRMQDLLYFQSGQVTRFTRKKIMSHVMEGMEILMRHHVMDEKWINTVLQHHEQMDGNGYPHGLTGEWISEPARILRIADIYCAKISRRARRSPIPPHLAWREIYTNEQGHFVDSSLVGVFINELGLFPSGLYVSLANGDVAIVVSRGSTPHKPIVRSLIAPTGIPYLKPVLHESANAKYAIREPVWMSKRMVSVDRDWLWGHGD